MKRIQQTLGLGAHRHGNRIVRNSFHSSGKILQSTANGTGLHHGRWEDQPHRRQRVHGAKANRANYQRMGSTTNVNEVRIVVSNETKKIRGEILWAIRSTEAGSPKNMVPPTPFSNSPRHLKRVDSYLGSTVLPAVSKGSGSSRFARPLIP